MNKLCIIALFILLISGCKKKDSSDKASTTIKNKTELLTDHSWQLTALTVDPPAYSNGVFTTDAYSSFTDCRKDDVVKYNTDNTVIYDEGATKCKSSDPQSKSGTWSFNPDETTIIESGLVQTILDLNATGLKISYKNEVNGVNFTYTATYSEK